MISAGLITSLPESKRISEDTFAEEMDLFKIENSAKFQTGLTLEVVNSSEMRLWDSLSLQ